MVDGGDAGTPAGHQEVLAGRYRLVRRLAEGGMATVWEGRDEILARPVAIKIPHTLLAADPASRERFRREAVAAARLAHPGIVATYDTGVDGPTDFIVMELVPGRTLRDLVAEGPVPAETAVALAAQVAEALDAAHSAGLIHRDIKPANLLLVEGGTLPRVKVADFGVARAQEVLDQRLSGASVTREGLVVGTARYLAPEQVAAQPLDGRTDVYALGCVLHELLAGSPPFVRETDLAIALAHLTEPPPSLRTLGVLVEPPLEALVLACLAKEPGGRPASARLLAEQLRAFASPPPGPPTAAVPAVDLLGGAAPGRARGPSGPPEREAQGPSGPTKREAQGPSGPPERGAKGQTAPQAGDGAPVTTSFPAAPRPQPAAPATATFPAAARPGAAPWPAAAGARAAAQGGEEAAQRVGRRGRHAAPAVGSGGQAARAARRSAKQPIRGAVQSGQQRDGPSVTPAPSPRGATRPVRRPTRSRTPLVVVGGLVLAALVTALAVVVLPRSSSPRPGPGERPTGPGVAGGPTVASVRSFDPAPGDGRENDAQLDRLTDDDPATTWSSDRYRQPPVFGNIKKGVGLVLALQQPARIGTVRVRSTSAAWAAQVYVAAAPASTLSGWGQPVARAAGIDGDVEIDIDGQSGGAILLWFTDPGRTGQVVVGEIELAAP